MIYCIWPTCLWNIYFRTFYFIIIYITLWILYTLILKRTSFITWKAWAEEETKSIIGNNQQVLSVKRHHCLRAATWNALTWKHGWFIIINKVLGFYLRRYWKRWNNKLRIMWSIFSEHSLLPRPPRKLSSFEQNVSLY